jgi:hypothetical protein
MRGEQGDFWWPGERDAHLFFPRQILGQDYSGVGAG